MRVAESGPGAGQPHCAPRTPAPQEFFFTADQGREIVDILVTAFDKVGLMLGRMPVRRVASQEGETEKQLDGGPTTRLTNRGWGGPGICDHGSPAQVCSSGSSRQGQGQGKR